MGTGGDADAAAVDRKDGAAFRREPELGGRDQAGSRVRSSSSLTLRLSMISIGYQALTPNW